MNVLRNNALSKRRIWAAPILLGLASVFGLTAALLSDGIGDVLSWVALAAPTVVALWFSLRPRQE